jgi:class 3 adenylate cyclase
MNSFSRLSRITRDFFTHSGHVPLVLLILEALLARPGYFSRIDPYLLLTAGVCQASLRGWRAPPASHSTVFSNLVGPLFYSVTELLAEDAGFFAQLHHQAYWAFALGFAAIQGAQQLLPRGHSALVLAENVLRSSVPLVLYALFEARIAGVDASVWVFFEDSAHRFLALVLLLLGGSLGLADVSLRRSMVDIQLLTDRLRTYSQWALGSTILERAMGDASTLALKRTQRAVLFLDIRGFTAWSERKSPEEVVDMLNAFYATTEGALGAFVPIKLKYTADEVMAVFADAQGAIHAGKAILAALQVQLNGMGLTVGGGVHFGNVVEGVMGAQGAKAYDFIGDTVNTAQRLCDAAVADELLASVDARNAAGLPALAVRDIVAKGKSTSVQVVRV